MSWGGIRRPSEGPLSAGPLGHGQKPLSASSQDPDVVDDAHRAKADVDVSQRDRAERAPGEEHVMAVDRADAEPRPEARSPAARAREAVDVPAGHVPQRLAGER